MAGECGEGKVNEGAMIYFVLPTKSKNMDDAVKEVEILLVEDNPADAGLAQS